MLQKDNNNQGGNRLISIMATIILALAIVVAASFALKFCFDFNKQENNFSVEAQNLK